MAEVCKTPYPGSNPGRASNISTGHGAENKASVVLSVERDEEPTTGLNAVQNGPVADKPDANPTPTKRPGQKPPRPVRIIGGIAEVPLTRGYTAIIDAADAHLVAHVSWTAHTVGGGRVYARNYRLGLLHRHLLGNPLKCLDIDHADGDGLNNRRENLRLCTRSENVANAVGHADAEIPFCGVSRTKEGRFRAMICVNGKNRHIGHYDTPEEAARAYDMAAREYFGKFARTNFASTDRLAEIGRMVEARTEETKESRRVN